MLSRAWRPLAGTTVLVGVPAALYAYYARPAAQESFDLAVRVRGPDGRPAMSTRSFSLLSKDAVDARIGEHARTDARTLADGRTWRWSTASLAANDPIEDASAHAILARADTVKGPAGDLLFFGVMDGHGGFHTSRLLSRTLIPAVVLELQALAADPAAMVPKAGVLQSVMQSVFGRAPGAPPAPVRFDASPPYVALALQTAFANLDSELINAPLKLLAQNISPEARASKVVPDLSAHPMAAAVMQPAMSGACVPRGARQLAHGRSVTRAFQAAARSSPWSTPRTSACTSRTRATPAPSRATTTSAPTAPAPGASRSSPRTRPGATRPSSRGACGRAGHSARPPDGDTQRAVGAPG
jgi:pyruvate dehydrogenase phosphatase